MRSKPPVEHRDQGLQVVPDDLSALIEQAPLAIIIHHRGDLLYANQAGRKIFALEADQNIRDYTVLDFARPEDHAEIKQRLAHIAQGEADFGPYELKMRRLDGHLFDAELQASSLKLENKPDLVQVYIQDISERKEIERAMFDAEQRYRAMAEKNPHFIFILQEGLIIYSNHSANNSLAHSRQDLFHPPQAFTELLEASSQKQWAEKYQNLQEGQTVEPFIVQLSDLRQQFIPCLISMIPLDNSQLQKENFTQILVVASNLSHLETENPPQFIRSLFKTAPRQKQHKQNEQNQDEFNAFVYAVSHDLRSPLHHISGFTDATLDEFGEQLGQDGRSYLERVLKSVGLMTHLLDALLDLSRLSHKDLSLKRIDLSGLCRAIILDMEQDPEIKNWTNHQSISLHIDQDLELVADPDQMRQALENLLHNAIKFSAANKAIDIYVGRILEKDNSGQAQKAQTFYVRDEGVGFDMSQADRLFAPFQRLHGQSEFSGLGMGLATVRRIISRHGGEVWAESKPGHGTSVFFTIPNAQS